MNKTIVELAQSMKGLEVTRSGAMAALKKKNYAIEDINEALTEVYGEKVVAKCDWEARVRRLRELVEMGFTQKEMAEMVVAEGLFGGMATAKQCMPYIKMAQEWAAQEVASKN